MTFSEFEQAVRDWIVTTSGLADNKVIKSYGSGPRPVGQYATMNIVTTNKMGEDVRKETRQVGGEIQADYFGPRKAMVSINFYRDDVMTKAIKLKSSLDRVITQDYFNTLDIGIVEQSDIRHLPEQVGNSWEDRTQCDFFFHVVFTETDPDIGEIKQIEVTNEINDELIVAI